MLNYSRNLDRLWTEWLPLAILNSCLRHATISLRENISQVYRFPQYKYLAGLISPAATRNKLKDIPLPRVKMLPEFRGFSL